MSAVREYLLSLVAVSLLTVLSRSLIPEGGVRRVASVVCALLLVLCALSPHRFCCLRPAADDLCALTAAADRY